MEAKRRLESAIVKSKNKDLFIKVPNDFIYDKNTSPYIYATIIAISTNFTFRGKSIISIAEVLRYADAKISRNKTSAFYEVITSINALQATGYISLETDISNISVSDAIYICINEKFNPQEKFTIIYDFQLEAIYNHKGKSSKRNMISLFFLIAGYSMPVFSKDINFIMNKTSMCKNTVINALKDLIACSVISKVTKAASRRKDGKFIKESNEYIVNTDF